MSPELKHIALEFAQVPRRITHGHILTYRLIGLSVVETMRNKSEFGANPVEKLAAYVGVEPKFFRNLATLAKAFSKDRLVALVEELPPTVTYSHLLVVSRANAEYREQLLQRLASEDLSVRELHLIVDGKLPAAKRRARGGGRKPKRPTSPHAAAHEIATKFQELNNRGPVWKECLFDALDTCSSDICDEILMGKLGQAKAEMERFQVETGAMVDQVDNAILTIQLIMADRAKYEKSKLRRFR
jgi:hypothetical protein